MEALFLASLALFPLVSQTRVDFPKDQEASDYSLDTSDGSQPLQVTAEGSWTAKLASGWGAGFSPAGFFLGVPPYGIDQGFVFSQVPDLSVTARLLDRYFLEVVYTGSVESNTFEIGYDGQPGEVLRWFKAGNTPFRVEPRAGSTVAPGRPGSPGIGLGLSLGQTTHELLLRYEDGSRETLKFRGFTPSVAGVVRIEDWIRGRFFRVNSGKVSPSLTVWLENPTDAQGLRLARPDEATAFSATGEIRLAKAATGKVWASWAGQSPLEIYVPGAYSVFELADRYLIPVGSDPLASAVVEYKNSFANGFQVTIEPGTSWFSVSGSSSPPFLDLVPGVYQNSSTPIALGASDWQIRFPSASLPGPTWALGTDVVETSLSLSRNGFLTRDFSFDPGAGTVTPKFPVDAGDEIVISFQRTQKNGTSPDAFGWLAGHWDLGLGQSLEYNTSVRWNTVKDRFTKAELEAPGLVTAAGQWEGSLENLAWTLRLEAGALLPDSTSGRQLLLMDQSGATVTLDGNSLRPAAPPGTLDTATLSALKRGSVFFRDFSSLDPFLGSVSFGRWSEAVARQPYSNGGLVGPYLALDPNTGSRMAVLEAHLEAYSWAGLQLALDKGKPRDLSATTRIALPVRLASVLPAGAKVYLQVGHLGEDFDGSGAVQTLANQSRRTLPFRDQINGFSMGFPIPESTDWTNDGQGDGVANGPGAVSTYDITSQVSTESTVVYAVPLLSDRFQLRAANGYSVLVSSPTAGDVVLFVGPAHFEGATWAILPDSSSLPASSVTPVDLPNSQGNTSLISWISRPQWTAEAHLTAFHSRQYQHLAVTFRVIDASVKSLQLIVSDASFLGLNASWTAKDTTDWQTATIDLATGDVWLDGTIIAKATLANLTAAWDRVRLTVSGKSNGSLELKPLEATDPLWDFRLLSTEELVLGKGDAVLSLRSAQTQSSQNGLNWDVELGTVLKWGPANLSTSFTADESQAFHGNYRAGIDLGQPDGVTFSWQDHFGDLSGRSETLGVSLPVFGKIQAKASVIPQAGLERSFELTWTPVSPIARAQLQASTKLRLLSAVTPARLAPSDLWLASWGWLVPEDTAQASTFEMGSLALNWQGDLLGFRASSQAQVVQLAGSPWKVAPYAEAKIAFPVQDLQRSSSWLWEPQLGWKLTSNWEEVSGLPPSSLIPVATSLVLGSVVDRQLETNAGLSVSGGSWGASSVGSWAQGRNSGLEFQVFGFTLQSAGRADNLFGNAGIWPIFKFYRTDTLSWSVDTAVTQGSRASDSTWKTQTTVKPELLFTPRESLAADVRVSASAATVVLQLSPEWKVKVPANLPFEVPGWISPRKFDRQLQFSTVLLLRADNKTGSLAMNQFEFTEKNTLTLSDKSVFHFGITIKQVWDTQSFLTGLLASADIVLSF